MTYGWVKGSTRRWRTLRARKLSSEPRCERCLARGKLAVAEQVHHRVPLAEGGSRYDEANLESLCSACHEAVHGGRVRGCDVHGIPLDPDLP